MRDVVSSGRLTVIGDATRAVQDTDVSFVCVGTPSRVNGEQDQTAVLRVAEQIGVGLRDHDRFHVVVVRSTVRLGTVDGQLREILESTSGRRLRRRLRAVLPAGVFARRDLDSRLRQPAVHRNWNSVGAGRANVAGAVRPPSVRVHRDRARNRRSTQVRLQRVPRSQDHIRERDRADRAGDEHRLACRHGSRAPRHAIEHQRRHICAQVLRSAGRVCRRICVR